MIQNLETQLIEKSLGSRKPDPLRGYISRKKAVASIAREAGFPPPKNMKPKKFLELTPEDQKNWLRIERFARRPIITGWIGACIVDGRLVTKVDRT